MSYQNLTGFPSVTTILKRWIDSDWFTPEAAARGSAVHAACAAYVQGLYVVPLAPDHQPYFDSFRRWADMALDQVLIVEERLTDEQMGYCGQLDLCCTLKGSPDPALIDLKTSQAAQKWWKMQSSAYQHLVAVSREIVCPRRLSLRLKNDGTGCLADEHSGPADWIAFRSALNVYRYFKEAA